MVMVKRRSGSGSIPSLSSSHYMSALPFGDGRESPQSLPLNSTPWQKSKRPLWRSQNFDRSPLSSIPSWILPAIVGIIALSWCTASYWNYQLRSEIQNLQYDLQVETMHHKEAEQTLQDAMGSQKILEAEVQKLEKKKEALEHELRMAQELEEGETLELEHASISDTILKRQAVLQDKVDLLRKYIQDDSRREVLEK